MGCPPELATKNDWYMALAYTVLDRLLANWVQTLMHLKEDVKVVSYLSAEFLLGPQLENNLINLGIWEQVEEGVSGHGLKLEDLLEQESEPGLGKLANVIHPYPTQAEAIRQAGDLYNRTRLTPPG
jgi:glycogen phosphorylase